SSCVSGGPGQWFLMTQVIEVGLGGFVRGRFPFLGCHQVLVCLVGFLAFCPLVWVVVIVMPVGVAVVGAKGWPAGGLAGTICQLVSETEAVEAEEAIVAPFISQV